jgi:uncharacterized membrane protein (DUF4010 family)
MPDIDPVVLNVAVAIRKHLIRLLVCAGLAATFYGAEFTVRALRQRAEAEVQGSHAFSLSTAFVFALTLSIILVVCAALQHQFGENGVIFAAAIAGFADTIQQLSPLHVLLHPESSLRLTLFCPFWPGFRPTPSARSCLPLPAADFRSLFA